MSDVLLDLFAGTGSSLKAAEDQGLPVAKVELDTSFPADLHADILDVTVDDLLDLCGGRPLFAWASPPCQAFSVASIGHHWTGGRRAYVPKTEAAAHNQELVEHTVRLLAGVNPSDGWLMENPRGVLRKLPAVAGLQRRTVTYCQYGDTRMKPTDLWGPGPALWTGRRKCRNGDPCHEPAPRGAKTGTQGRADAVSRGMVPYELGATLVDALQAGRFGLAGTVGPCNLSSS